MEFLSVSIKLDMTQNSFFFSVYANLGFGLAAGCVIITAEIIYAKLTMPGNLQSGCGTILLLLIISAILTAVTLIVIQTYHYPSHYLIQKILYYNPIVVYQFKTGKLKCEKFLQVYINFVFLGSNFGHLALKIFDLYLTIIISAAVLITVGATAELYIPSSGTSCMLPTRHDSRYYHTLEDGGLMCGGYSLTLKK